MAPIYFTKTRTTKNIEYRINTSVDNITNWLKANDLMINDKNSNLIAFKVGNSQSSDEVIMIYIDKQVLEHKT